MLPQMFFLALPCDRLPVEEYEYYAVMYHDPANDESILLVGCEDDTTITVSGTPLALNFAISKQGTYLIRSSNDLSGTRIVSDKPISVFTGRECTNVPVDVCCCDHLTEQVPPTVTWGNFFLHGCFLCWKSIW